jgi:hypothetical protein
MPVMYDALSIVARLMSRATDQSATASCMPSLEAVTCSQGADTPLHQHMWDTLL